MKPEKVVTALDFTLITLDNLMDEIDNLDEDKRYRIEQLVISAYMQIDNLIDYVTEDSIVEIEDEKVAPLAPD